ncbi:MAG: porin [Gammaproteobacteria bacterium]|nr:porin [Gammaproteobacteria bacterium]
MMKKILAAAIVSAFAAPAFAATANVDVYGKLHVSVSGYNDQVATAEDLQISSNASRIGFKGAEDLGGGLSAIWQLEQTVSLDEKGGNFATRNSFVGLKGGFGTVLLGNHDTPLKRVGRKVDLFGDTIADSRNVTGITSDTRASNLVAYLSPSFGGLNFEAAYSNDLGTAANTGDRVDNSLWSASATYNNGPLYLGLGYSDGDAFDAVGIDNEYSLAAGFTMGDFKVVGQYVKNENNLADYDAWVLGGAYKMGNITLKANYMEGEVDGSTLDVNQFTVGADYSLSKRTTVYALYADGENVVFGSGVGSTDRVASGQANGDISVLSLGMIHTF